MNVSLSCLECGVKFIQNRKDKIYCSKKCAKKNYKSSKENLIKINCPECDKDFQIENWDYNKRIRLGRTTIYCSKGCASINSNKNRYEKRLLKCLNCEKQETVNETDTRIKYCSQECYREHDKERLVELAKRIGKESAQKISQTHKEKFKNGYIHPWLGRKHSEITKNKISEKRIEYNKTHEGYWKGKKLSEESKQKMSETRVKNLLSGKYNNIKFMWEKGRFYSDKNKKEIVYRSSWEKKYYLFLENNDEISTYKVEHIGIPYLYKNCKRWYVPDIIVEYKSGERFLREIKPSWFKDTEINKLKFESGQQYCQENNMTFEVITEKDLKDLGIL